MDNKILSKESACFFIVIDVLKIVFRDHKAGAQRDTISDFTKFKFRFVRLIKKNILLLFLIVSLSQSLPISIHAQDTFPQIGIASYYASEFHGKKTSYGERFSIYAMTAAHQTLPLHTKVRVTNLSNRKSVIVRINDAGPFKDNRIIDLSKAAAMKLGMMKTGTAKVKIEIIEQDATTDDYYQVGKKNLSGYAIQLGSHAEFGNAIENLERLEREVMENLFLKISEVKNERAYRIVTAGSATREQAEARLTRLRKKGQKGFVFQIR